MSLHYWPYCATCKQPFDFDPEEPFAYCKCGTTEWGDPRPAAWVQKPIWSNWKPTAENINRLPEPVRMHVYALETQCDPAGMVRENAQLRDTNEALQCMVRRLTSERDEADRRAGAAEREMEALMRYLPRSRELAQRESIFVSHYAPERSTP